MVEKYRILQAGSDGLLIEFGGLQAALSAFQGLSSKALSGVRELVPAARTVLIRFDQGKADREIIAAAIAEIDGSKQLSHLGEFIEVPVIYDGEDLDEVARLLDWSVPELIARHQAATFSVAFTGFAPGFAYMTCDDPSFDVPRRSSPRSRIPAGAVAIAGKFGGIYPSDSPGGWQLLGRTPLKMWDAERGKAALLAPGDQVRFIQITQDRAVVVDRRSEDRPRKRLTATVSGLVVRRADRPALFQDLGRPQRADQGISPSGALDQEALGQANRLVGNPPGLAALEITFGGFAVEARGAMTVATAGAPTPLTIRAGNGRIVSVPFGRPLALDDGDQLTIDAPSQGTRTYLALRGGFTVREVIGSSSVDILAKLGPEPVKTADFLPAANRPTIAVSLEEPSKRLPSSNDSVTLDVILGPRDDWFTSHGLDTFLTTPWKVQADTNRIGMRLSGEPQIERKDASELPSEGCVRGAIQIPASGHPIVFLSDHPVTGGYPVIAVVASHHLDLMGQIPIGTTVRFKAIPAPGSKTETPQ